MRASLQISFVLALLSCESARAIQMQVFHPVRSRDAKCGAEYSSLHYSVLKGVYLPTEKDRHSPGQVVQMQWNVIGPSYEKLVKDPAERKYLMETDAKMEPDQITYVAARNEGTGEVEAWCRVVSSSKNFAPILEFKEGAAGAAKVPMERYEGMKAYLDENFPHRMEIGRLAVLEKLGPKRSFVWGDMLTTILELAGGKDEPPTDIVIDVQDLSFFEKYGFKLVDLPESVKMLPGHHLMVAKFSELHERFGLKVIDELGDSVFPGALPDKREPLEARLKKIDDALAKAPEHAVPVLQRPNFERAKTLLALGRIEEAKKIANRLRWRDPDDDDTKSLCLRISALEAKAQGKLLDENELAIFGDLRTEIGGHAEAAYMNAWVAVESLSPLAKEKLARFVQPIHQRNGAKLVHDMSQLHYDPVTQRGDPAQALFALDLKMQEPPNGTSHVVHLYRAELLEKLGRKNEAELEKKKARLCQPEL